MTHAVPGRDKPADTRETPSRPAPAKPPPRRNLNPMAAMALQRQAGNRAVASLVTPAEPVAQRGILDDVAGVAGDVKGRVLGQFGTWARRIPGYGVLCVALGKDPITEQPVARDATAVVGALVGLIPGGAALWDNLQQSGAVAKAGEWLSAELPKLGLTWEAIRGLFARAWDAVSVTDLINPSAVWDRLSGIFSEPIGRLRTFAGAAGTKLMELVFEGVLGGAGGIGGQVMGIIHRAGDVVRTIVRDPIGFAGNLVSAVRGGLGQFVGNILAHLRTGLFGWLTGALRGAVQIPQRFDFGGILSMVASMLGLTWSWLRERLVRTLGERTVRLVETGVDWVRDIATRGLAAVSQRLGDMASGFVDTVIGGIRDWVANSIVGAAITRLISMFNPAGAVIQAILAVYNTIRFFIERAQQLGALAESVFGSIAAIASGSLDAAKNAVESALGRAVPVVLGFLARLIGLGDVAAPVRNIITRIRGAVDGAADRVIGWVPGVARRLPGVGRRGGPDESPEAKQRRLNAGLQAATSAVNRFSGRAVGPLILRPVLAAIKLRHGLTELKAVSTGERWRVSATVNPTAEQDTAVLVSGLADPEEVTRMIQQATSARERANAIHQRDHATFRRPVVVAVSGDNLSASYETPGSGDVRQAQRDRPGRGDTRESGSTTRRYLETDAAMWQDLGALHRPLVAEAVRNPAAEYPLPPGNEGARQQREHFERTGRYLPQQSRNDQPGTGTGRSSLVHAEKQLLRRSGSKVYGVSTNPMCSDCQVYFRAQAMGQKTVFVAADVGGVHIFLPDGSVRSTVEEVRAAAVNLEVRG